MDVAALRGCIQSTIDPNADIRRHAELQLKHAEESAGFIGALLDILESDPEPQIKLSTVVYLKNRVTRGWDAEGEGFTPPSSPIPQDEKPAFRSRIVPLLVASTPQVRGQLVPLIQKVLNYDFPQNWPDFVDITIQLLHTQDAAHVLAGLQCLLALCRVYRFKAGENRADLDKILEATFPLILSIGNKLVAETSTEAGEMLRIIMKTYKHAIYFELLDSLREQSAIVGWCELFIRVVGKDAPPDSLPDDFDERDFHPWWKAKKWAFANLNRLFVRYGNPSTLTKSSEAHEEFAKRFIANFAPEILKAYLQEIDKWVAKTAWLSKACLSSALTFLDECVKPKSTWNHLKPHLENLVAHVLFPILCMSDDEVELFESDPSEYIHKKLNYYNEVSSPDIAATNFLVTLTKSRKKQTFTVLNFVNGVVNKYESIPNDQKNPREKEGALRMIGTLASIMLAKKSPIADQVEFFFVQHVFPEFRSQHGYLRARACDTLDKFQDLQFKDQNNLVIIYRNILESMTDPDLPVRVEAALALQPLIKHDFIRNSMKQNIPQIMQQLLKLANEVDVDALANVMEDFVEVFATELTPFAVALTEQLRDTYLRIVRDLISRNVENEDDEVGEFLDDKSITALGVLQTIGTLILTLESTPDVLLHLETILMPVIQITLENTLYDQFNEVFEIIDSCTFSAKSISPTMWMAFELIHKTFKSGTDIYLEDMLPALQNYVNYGKDVMIQNRSYLDAMVEIIISVFKEDKVGGMDRICSCKLAETVLLNLPGQVDNYVPTFIELAMKFLTDATPKVKSYRIHLMELVINCVYYNPGMTLQVLESKGWTNKFFSLWFSNIDSFTRVHDKKLAIGAIVGLLSVRGEEVPASIQQGWPRLLQGIVRLFQTLPQAIKNREDARKEENNIDDSYSVGDEDEWSEGVDWTNQTEEPEEDVQDAEGNAYLEFLSEEAQKIGQLGEVDDDDLEEEGLLETPLDDVEPYGLFRDQLLKLQQEQPQLYESLTKNLSADEQRVIQSVVTQADANRAAAAAAAGQANGGSH